MEVLGFVVLGVLIVISPGADFVLVFRNSMNNGKTAGLLTAIGIMSGVFIHISYSVFGIGQLVSQSPFWFNIVKYLGAFYLIYIGFKGLFTLDKQLDIQGAEVPNKISRQFFIQGFFCNVLNPKTMLFFLSIFSQLLSTDSPQIGYALVYGVYLALLHGAWFAIVAIFVSSDYLFHTLHRYKKRLSQACGVGLILFGGLLSFS